MSVNKVILVGRLGRDPEVRVTGSGITVATLTLATDFTSKRNGEEVKETQWHRLVAYDRQAELCRDYLSKGALVYAEGRLKTREWEDRQGSKRKTTEIIIDRITMLGGRNNAGNRQGLAPGSNDQEQPAPAGDDRGEIPF